MSYLEDWPSNFWFFPLLSLRRRYPVLSLVIFLLDICPICREHCSSTCLEALHHSFSFLRVTLPINLLEEGHAWVLTVVLTMLKHVAFNLFINFVPILPYFWARGVGDLFLGFSLRNAKSVSSQESPVLTLLLLLHHDFNAIKTMSDLRSNRDDISKKDQVKFIDLFLALNRKFDAQLIISKLDLQILLLLD